jgi:hypothetical protein
VVIRHGSGLVRRMFRTVVTGLVLSLGWKLAVRA